MSKEKKHDRRPIPRPVELRQNGHDEPATIEGMAAVFYREGQEGTEFELWDFGDERAVERIMPGAFDSALARGDDVRALFNHDPNLVLGRTAAGTLALSITAEGLRYEIDPAESSTYRDLVEHIGRGDISGSSFAFFAIADTWRVERVEGNTLEIREILDVELFDVSPVTFPAFSATVASLRGARLDEARASHRSWKNQLQEKRERARRERQIAALDLKCSSWRDRYYLGERAR